MKTKTKNPRHQGQGCKSFRSEAVTVEVDNAEGGSGGGTSGKDTDEGGGDCPRHVRAAGASSDRSVPDVADSYVFNDEHVDERNSQFCR